MSSTWSPISSIASSQDIRFHLPPSSFIGYFRAALAVAVLAHRRALGAVRAEVERRVEVRLLTGPHAILNFADDTAAH